MPSQPHVNQHREVELKFLVPAQSRASLVAELARGSASVRRVSLAAMYLDTPDRRLAAAGIAWRLRREGRRWVQTLKAAGRHLAERFEHEVVRPDARADATAHAGTPVGDRLMTVLRAAQREGLEVGVRYRTEVRRTVRRIRARGAVVEIAFDEGRLLAQAATALIREIEFELVAGDAAPMLALAERWRHRHQLVYDPHSKAERGDRLADGSPFPSVRKGGRPAFRAGVPVTEAFGAVLDECLAQISRNAIGVVQGDPGLRVEHVHQLRVGIRRLRSAVRCFEGWVPEPAPWLVDDLRALFAALGQVRDSDVLGRGVAAELLKAGAPPATRPSAGPAMPSPSKIVADDAAQRVLLGWMAWRLNLAASATADGKVDSGNDSFGGDAAKRLRRWHRRIVRDWRDFGALDEARLHALRKRVKRQRYAVEFFAAMLRPRAVERYLTALARVQECMGELNDLVVARASYQAMAQADPAAWFALGWISARLEAIRAAAERELGALADVEPPSH
jgi:inorganic triphosphatase YgiF